MTLNLALRLDGGDGDHGDDVFARDAKGFLDPDGFVSPGKAPALMLLAARRMRGVDFWTAAYTLFLNVFKPEAAAMEAVEAAAGAIARVRALTGDELALLLAKAAPHGESGADLALNLLSDQWLSCRDNGAAAQSEWLNRLTGSLLAALDSIDQGMPAPEAVIEPIRFILSTYPADNGAAEAERELDELVKSLESGQTVGRVLEQRQGAGDSRQAVDNVLLGVTKAELEENQKAFNKKITDSAKTPDDRMAGRRAQTRSMPWFPPYGRQTYGELQA
jgi:hypothetical protein